MAEPRRRALLVATDTYEDPGLRQLRAPSVDVGALERVLADPAIGQFEVRVLIDRPTEDLKLGINEFFDDAARDDLLLLYFACHGVLSEGGTLFFATRNTDRRKLLATAIEDRFVVDMTNESRARSIVLVLDCCHSGAFARGLVPRGGDDLQVAQRFKGQGRVTLCASKSLEYAFEESEAGADIKDLGAQGGSLFTGGLINGLSTGKADANDDGNITVDELFHYAE